jgi:hypothetical protein
MIGEFSLRERNFPPLQSTRNVAGLGANALVRKLGCDLIGAR